MTAPQTPSGEECETCHGAGDGRLGMFAEFIPWDARHPKGSIQAHRCPDCQGTGKKPSQPSGDLTDRAAEELMRVEGVEWKDATPLQRGVWLDRVTAAQPSGEEGRCGGTREQEIPNGPVLDCPGCPDCQPSGEEGEGEAPTARRITAEEFDETKAAIRAERHPHDQEAPQVSSAQGYDKDPDTEPAAEKPAIIQSDLQVSSGDGDWHYGAIRMGRRWFATRFHPSTEDNDGDLPDVGDTEFWEAGEWKPYSIGTFQEREREAGLLGVRPSTFTDEERQRVLAIASRLYATASSSTCAAYRDADFLRTLAGKEQR